jgi:hypothetical protein
MSSLLLAAVAGGLSSLTRPSILLMLPPAAVVVAAAQGRRSRPARGAMLAVLFIALWMATILPGTVRNYVMSGEPVLISSGQALTFVVFNLPSAGDITRYRDAFEGSMSSAAAVLTLIMIEHPREFFANLSTKLGFSLGMVQWMGTDMKPHPELVLTSLAYLVAIVFVREARSLVALPLHLFVLTHLATLMLTMPSNYGYRLLLPMYLFMPVFGAAALQRAFRRSQSMWRSRRAD